MKWSLVLSFAAALSLFRGSADAAGSSASVGSASQPAMRPAANEILACLDPAEDPQQRDRRAALERAVDGADTPEARVSAELALANWLLAEPMARPATRVLLGAAAAKDADVFSERAAAAGEHLRRARLLLKPDLPNARKLRVIAGTLEGFAKVFAAVAAAPKDGKCEACAGAAIGLAAARESDKPAVASAALLWQSYAWELAGRQERALTSLPEALQRPVQMPWDFFSRLLRLRILADSGQPEVAMTLAIRIQTLCDQWFAGEPAEAIAARKRLVSVVQYRIALAWRERLKNKGSAKAELEELISRIRKDLADADGAAVFTLAPPIPHLAAPSAAATSAPVTQSASGPATQPASIPAGEIGNTLQIR